MANSMSWMLLIFVALSFVPAMAVRKLDDDNAAEGNEQIATEVQPARGTTKVQPPRGTKDICEGTYAGDGKTCRTQTHVSNPDECGQVWALWSPKMKDAGTWEGSNLQDGEAVFVQCAKAYHMTTKEGQSPCWEHNGMFEEGTPKQCSAPGVFAKLRCDDELPAEATTEAVPLQSTVKKTWKGDVYFVASNDDTNIEITKNKLCSSGCRTKGGCHSSFSNFITGDKVVAAADNFADLVHWSEAIGSKMQHLFTRKKMKSGADVAEALRKWDHEHGVAGADLAF